jgi:RNA recognition motif-containing protein
MDPMSGMSKGFGFVRFGKEEDRDKVRVEGGWG